MLHGVSSAHVGEPHYLSPPKNKHGVLHEQHLNDPRCCKLRTPILDKASFKKNEFNLKKRFAHNLIQFSFCFVLKFCYFKLLTIMNASKKNEFNLKKRFAHNLIQFSFCFVLNFCCFTNQF
jgi:hypothetical protein